MAEKSDIEWTDATWNPFWGCRRMSAGCDHCYAAKLAMRGQHPHFRGLADQKHWTGEVRRASDRTFLMPLGLKQPHLIFTASMSDVFYEGVKNEWRHEFHGIIRDTQWHTYQVLTKRPHYAATFYRKNPDLLLDNIWLGASVEGEDVAFRIRHLTSVPVPRDQRFLSVEPMISPLSLKGRLSGIRWVITGGESGQNARPVHPDWVRRIRDECAEARVAFFHKQWGKYLFNPLVLEKGMSEKEAQALDSYGKGGALLDGKLHRDFPDF